MYIITDYDNRYKPTNKSGGELKNADYVKLPVNPKGDGLEALLEQKRGLEVFGIWCLLLEKTTSQKPETRGKLLNFQDKPASSGELAKSISLKGKKKLVEYALSLLVSIGWIEFKGVAEISSEDFRERPPKLSKDKLSKDKIKDKLKEYGQNSEEFRLSELLGELILKRKPDFTNILKAKKNNWQKWAVHINELLRLDRKTPERIKAVIQWSQQDDFWQNNILSTQKLRKQFDTLDIKLSKEKPVKKEVPKFCFVDHKPATREINRSGKRKFICEKCFELMNKAPDQKSFKKKVIPKYFLSFGELEKLIQYQKARE